MLKLRLKVIPRSGRREVRFVDGSFKIWIASPPEKGKANDEFMRILADFLSIPCSSITIVSGRASRNKVVDIEGITLEEIRKIA